jgi:hypothetical protein
MKITIALRDYDDPERGIEVADEIRESGEVRYTSARGEQETAYVESVTIEDGL